MSSQLPSVQSSARNFAVWTNEKPDLAPIDPRIERLVEDLIGRVADKWTMLILEVLVGSGTLRFTQLSKLVGA
jgi:DNA-binding HxlR family transcriptional regulator